MGVLLLFLEDLERAGLLEVRLVGALLVGFGAQIWFVAGFAKAGRAE